MRKGIRVIRGQTTHRMPPHTFKGKPIRVKRAVSKTVKPHVAVTVSPFTVNEPTTLKTQTVLALTPVKIHDRPRLKQPRDSNRRHAGQSKRHSGR